MLRIWTPRRRKLAECDKRAAEARRKMVGMLVKSGKIK